MAGERNYLRIPPDSTGKRIRLVHGARIAYSSKTPGYVWKVGREDYNFGAGWEFHLHEVYEASSTAGVIDVSYNKNDMYAGTNPAVGDTINDPVSGNPIATIASVTDLWNNATNIVGYDNPQHGVNVDPTGSMNIRFSEGLPQLDAFGKLRTSGATILGEYIFSSGILQSQFSGMFMNGGSASWDQNKRALLLTNTTASGAHSSYTSNTYHHYFPGSSHLFIGTFALGDSGKANLMREWGMFDDKNGFFFMLDGTTLGVGFRTNTSGSVVQTFIPRTDWNGDKVDGTGPSGMNLDVTKDNIYWIDVQWLGAGRLRFGTYYNGQRVVIHEYYHGNNGVAPITAMASLPVCIHQMNTGATGSTSEIRAFCIAVWTESTLDVRTTAAASLKSFSKTITSNTNFQYIGTLSPVLNLPNGQPNRSLYWPTEIEVVGWDENTGEPAKFQFEIYAEAVLGNVAWSPVSVSSTVDYDTNANLVYPGLPVAQRFIAGKDTIDTTTTFDNMQYGAFKNYSENGGTVVQNITNITQDASGAVVTLGTALRSGTAAVSGRTYFRDGQVISISNVVGMTQVNGNSYYARPVAVDQVRLFTNSSMTTPLDSSGFTAYSSGGTATGDFGGRFLFTLAAKKLFGANNISAHAKIAWKEVVQ